ncbi:Ubiquitin-associated domain/translation elongation factor EF-Ts [Macleaya cordata]|uniref:Ubiquitin-associated domain/translation elongation factor EF-Ts n=1 Tax=Macleaya cordata TaxID=56857 RepID=A0A200RD69_MACCD|nr:Ubiquitin-associated domain/translation elongation factor EF-Ts [Macleaya cordata]
MSPASRSKPKDKSSAKAAKEQQKSSSKASVPGTNGNGSPASAYNPLLGTFHTLETAPSISSPPPHNNGRFRNIDETDEQSRSSVGTGAEYDSVSNNDSCSGESEDQKDKIPTTTLRQESIPGCDNDKREKIRQKNERKHQRQRERRAQELHEKCSGYLMSRKLEALAQQLVAMGFTSERATMALILNEGRIEESVAWLFEGEEEAAQQNSTNLDSGSNLKIDISEELSRIADLEIKYKCSKQEVERAVVACEGDLEKASDNLRAQKQQETPASLQKTEDTGGDQPVVNNTGKLAVSVPPNLMKPPAKVITGPVTIQQRRDERDFNYTKAAAAAAATVVASPESMSRNLQSLRKSQPKSEWARPPQVATPAEKRWPPTGGSSSSVSYSLAPPLQGASPPPAAKVEARYVVVGNEVKNLQTGGAVREPVREPVIMMQRPQSINTKQNSPQAAIISTSPPGTAGWYPNHPNSAQGVEIMKSNGGLSYIPSTRNLNHSSNLNAQQYYPQSHYQQPFVSNPVMDPSGADAWGSSWNTTGPQSPSSSLAVPSSLGLFSGWGPTGGSGSTSPVDWNSGGSMPQFDYTSIDWTLETTSVAPKPANGGWWLDLASLVKNSRMYDSWSSANTTPSGSSNPPTMVMRSASSNGGGVCMAAGLQQEGVATTETTSQQGGSTSSSSVGPPQHEWTSPFAGKDLFSAPRQFVTSPSL